MYHKKRKKLKLKDKSKSRFMRFVNFFIVLGNKIGLTSMDNFLTNYVTTIGQTIYSTPPWPPYVNNGPVVIHELCHVEQWSVWYAIKYIFSRKYRMFVESVCCQAEMLCFPYLYANDAKLSKKARHFVSYGVSYEEALKQLKAREYEIEKGTPQPAANYIHHLWKLKDKS